MKKLWQYIMLLVVLLSVAILLFNENINLLKRQQELLDKFNVENIVDISGNVNLTELEKQKEKLEEEMVRLFSNDMLNIEEFNETLSELKENNSELIYQVETLSNKVSHLKPQKDSLAVEYETLNAKYQQIMKEVNTIKSNQENSVFISNVPTINQYPNYPTGCESVALAILLRYYGINVSPDEIISTLKKGDLPYKENGKLYGGNPELEFVGNPYSSSSYGVYNNPIADVANNYKSGVYVKDEFSFNEVLSLIDENRPVIVWTSINLALPFISTSWIYKPTGETISWKAQEHAVVVIGYNSNNIIISDPIGGTIKYQPRDVFESRYNYYGKKVVYY